MGIPKVDMPDMSTMHCTGSTANTAGPGSHGERRAPSGSDRKGSGRGDAAITQAVASGQITPALAADISRLLHGE